MNSSGDSAVQGGMSVFLLLLIAAFIVCILDAIGKAPLWPAVLLVIVALLIGGASPILR